MKRWRPSESWRPKGIMLLWVYGASFLICMLVSFIGQFFGLAGEGITIYPPVNWLSWALLVFSGIATAIFLSLLAGISMDSEYPAPQPHPFVTVEFWVSALGFIIIALVASATMHLMGAQVGGDSNSAKQTGAVIGIILAAVSVTVNYVKPLRRYTAAGLSFGAGAFFIIALFSMLS